MRRVPVLALSLALAFAAEAPARAQGADQARRAFEEGVALEKKRDYAGALARFRDAGAIKATPGVRYHEGYCLEMTGKLVDAAEAYAQAEKMAREQDKPEVVTAVRARLEPLSSRIPRLAITVDPSDADVRVDGVLVGKPELRVDPGDHEVSASAKGRVPKQVRVTVKESATERVSLALPPEEAAAPAPAAAAAAAPAPEEHRAEPPAEGAPERSIALPLAVTGGAVALAAGGVAAFVLAGQAQSDAEQACPSRRSCDSEKTEVRTLDALALGGFVGAAGLGALSVVLWSSRSTRVTTVGSTVVLGGTF